MRLAVTHSITSSRNGIFKDVVAGSLYSTAYSLQPTLFTMNPSPLTVAEDGFLFISVLGVCFVLFCVVFFLVQ